MIRLLIVANGKTRFGQGGKRMRGFRRKSLSFFFRVFERVRKAFPLMSVSGVGPYGFGFHYFFFFFDNIAVRFVVKKKKN